MTWRKVTIGSLCERIGTTDPRRRPDSAFRYIDISGIDRDLKQVSVASEMRGADAPSRARQVVRARDVLVSTVRPNLNAVAIVPAHLDGEVASTGFCVLRASNSLLEPRFLYYFSQSEPFVDALLQHVRGANYPAVTDRNVRDVEIPWPARSEQKKIVAMLGKAATLRQQCRSADQKTLRALPALFRNTFGDPSTWKDQDSSEPLGRLVDPRGGGTPSKKNPEYWGGDIPWVSPKDMKRDFIDDAEDHITATAVAETNTRLVPVNSILVVVRGMILARHVPLAVNVAPVAINQDMKALTVIDDRVSPLYLFAAMKVLSERLHASVGTAGHGTRKLDTDRLLSLPIHIPDRKRHDQFVQAFEKIREMNAARATIGPRIQRLFEVLLHRAFTGELTAGWREEHRDQLETEMQEQLEALEAAAAEKPKRGRRASASTSSDRGDGARNAGHDMFNKAALVTYIVAKCHDPSRPLGRTKLAKLFYLVQRRAEISLTEQFARRAAGPLDDAIPKVLSLARKNGWVSLAKPQGKLKPVVPGENPQPAIDHVKQRWADGLTVIDDALDTMKGWGWEALERWATVEHAAQQLAADGKPATLDAIKRVIASEPKWEPKLERDAFSDLNIQRTLKGLRDHGYLPAEAGANH